MVFYAYLNMTELAYPPMAHEFLNPVEGLCNDCFAVGHLGAKSNVEVNCQGNIQVCSVWGG